MILVQDEFLLVINKPSGLRVVPDGYDRSLPTVRTILEPEWGRLYIVHRLDKDTSGALLLARQAETHRDLSIQFAEHRVQKTYLALCLGEPAWDEKTIDFPLRVDGDRRHRTVADEQKGKPARTIVRVLRRFTSHCLLEARPLTGYTHQIRAHLALAGLPILGDPLYAYPLSWSGPRLAPSSAPAFSRTALHAAAITFTHPSSRQVLSVSAPLPADFHPFIPV